MATEQDSNEEYRRMSRRLREIGFELDDLRHKQDVIKAKHTKYIWLDDSFDKEKLKLAELTLRLEADPEYQATRKRERELILESGELEMESRLIERERWARELAEYQDDSELDVMKTLTS